MSLSSTTNKVIYIGNGATSVWPFSFPVLEADHLTVILTDGEGLETVLSASLYGLDGIGDPTGGSVTYPLLGSPIAAGTKLTLLRTVPYTQTTVLSNQGGYYPEVVERRFDQIYMALQQLEERVNRASLHPLSDPVTEQSNLALIQQLQPMNILSEQGDLLTRDDSAFKRLARGSAGQFLGVIGADLAWAIPSHPVSPQGRLTLSSGEPVMTADQTGKTSIFYTPYVGANVPIYDGSAFVPTLFTERSNDLTQSSTGKAGPAAAGPYQVIDVFVWNDDGTIRLTRGPRWRRSSAIAITVASPAVVTWNAHGLYDGATIRFPSTTGAVPTGISLNTDYFVTKIDANSFKLSTTLTNQIAGTFINTSGGQTGVITADNYTVDRGSGAGSCELERLNGIWVNKHDIAYGPSARKGTYVGTIYTNSASQVDFKMGSTAAGFGEAIIGIWNAYNRVNVKGTVLTLAGSWSVFAGWWPMARSATVRATMVSGLPLEGVGGESVAYMSCDAATSYCVTVAFRGNNVTTASLWGPTPGFYSAGGQPASLTSFLNAPPFLGLGYMNGLESATNYTSSYVLNNGVGCGLRYDWHF